MRPHTMRLNPVPFSRVSAIGLDAALVGSTDTTVLRTNTPTVEGSTLLAASTAAEGLIIQAQESGSYLFEWCLRHRQADGADIDFGLSFNATGGELTSDPSAGGWTQIQQASLSATAIQTISGCVVIQVSTQMVLTGIANGFSGAAIRFGATDGAAGAPPLQADNFTALRVTLLQTEADKGA